MKIEVGDILETGSNCIWNIVYSNDDVIKIQMGKTNFTYIVRKESLLHNVYVTKAWSLVKANKQLDMSALEEL